MKVYITKYCLTQGIFERKAEVCHSDEKMILCRGEYSVLDEYYRKPDWHKTLKEAQKKAEHMRSKSIEALENKIAKLEKLNFKIIEEERILK